MREAWVTLRQWTGTCNVIQSQPRARCLGASQYTVWNERCIRHRYNLCAWQRASRRESAVHREYHSGFGTACLGAQSPSELAGLPAFDRGSRQCNVKPAVMQWLTLQAKQEPSVVCSAQKLKTLALDRGCLKAALVCNWREACPQRPRFTPGRHVDVLYSQRIKRSIYTPESLPAAAPVTLRYRVGIYFKMPFKSRCCSRARGALTQFKCTNASKCWLTNRPKCEYTLEQFYSGMYSIFQRKKITQLGLKIARACATIFKGRPGLNCILK